MFSLVYIYTLIAKFASIRACIATVSPEGSTTTSTTTTTFAPGTVLVESPPGSGQFVPVVNNPSETALNPGTNVVVMYEPVLIESPPGSGQLVPVVNNPSQTAPIPGSNVVPVAAPVLIESPPGSGQLVPVVNNPSQTAQIPGSNVVAVTAPGTTVTVTTVSTTTPTTIQDCMTNCPSIYRGNCYGTAKAVCPTAAEANAMVQPDGGECQQTWTCPAGTAAYYYTGGNPVGQLYDATMQYAVCYANPDYQWYYYDGTTPIVAVSCESPA